MNILHLSPYYPDVATNHAGGVCMGHEIGILRELGDVRILTFISQERDAELYCAERDGGSIDAVRITGLSRAFHAATEPWMPVYFAARTSLRMWIKLIRAVRRYDIDAIHAEYSSMGQYMGIRKLFPRVRFNLVAHDVTCEAYERKIEALKASGGIKGSGPSRRLKLIWLNYELHKLRRTESRYFSRADTVMAFTEKDIRLIEAMSGRRDIRLIHTYTGLSDEELKSPPDMSMKEAGNIVYLGQMARPENHRAAMRLIDICLKVRESIPGLRLYIVGNAPRAELTERARELSASAAAGDARGAGGDESWINVTGYVDDVDLYIRRASIAVFPLSEGAGVKVKVLRAMALGTPVITGHIGAEGIDEDGEVIVPAESDAEYIEAMTDLLGDPERIYELGERSHFFIAEHCGWELTRETLGEIYGSL